MAAPLLKRAAAALISASRRSLEPGGLAMSAEWACAAAQMSATARRVSELKDPDFLALVELLHGVDCAWGNCELVLADPRQVYPALKDGDPHTIGDPWVADEFRFLGLRLMGTAT